MDSTAPENPPTPEFKDITPSKKEKIKGFFRQNWQWMVPLLTAGLVGGTYMVGSAAMKGSLANAPKWVRTASAPASTFFRGANRTWEATKGALTDKGPTIGERFKKIGSSFSNPDYKGIREAIKGGSARPETAPFEDRKSSKLPGDVA